MAKHKYAPTRKLVMGYIEVITGEDMEVGIPYDDAVIHLEGDEDSEVEVHCPGALRLAETIVKAVNEYADAEKALLELCSRHGYATGHGDTLADIIREIDGQIPGVCVGQTR